VWSTLIWYGKSSCLCEGSTFFGVYWQSYAPSGIVKSLFGMSITNNGLRGEVEILQGDMVDGGGHFQI